jgi:hypothetical protein
LPQGYSQNSLDVLGLGGTTPAAVAYSLRKVSSSYSGNAIQVRRSLDNATLNIGFDGSGNLDLLLYSHLWVFKMVMLVFGTIKVGIIDTS